MVEALRQHFWSCLLSLPAQSGIRCCSGLCPAGLVDGGSAISVFNLFQSFTVSHYVFIHTGKILPSFCFLMLNSPSSLSLLPYDRGSTSVAFHSAHSSMSSAGGAQHWTQHSRGVSPVLSRGEGSLPLFHWQYFCHAAQDAIRFLYYKEALLDAVVLLIQ